ncbi:MAG: ABC transporter substrate-binding protein [Synergistaceae bacterium]|jgi:iron complex transport system substrate-binding protein|nr:ABC transporter substrate-binding protein [Synergistaceae bacterium]
MEAVDDAGFRVEFEAPVDRIVSLYTAHTENLIAIGGASRLVAASSGDDPELVGDVPLLAIKPGLEQIVSLAPDLVLTRPMQVRSQEALYGRLRALGVKVLAIDPPKWEEFPDYIELLSRLIGDPSPTKAASLAKSLLSSGAAEDGAVGALLITNGRSLATCAPDSWAARMMALAGFRNAAAGSARAMRGGVIANFGAERILAADKDIDVVLLQRGAMNTMSAADFRSDPRFLSLRAVRDGKVFDVSEADISRPSLLRLKMGVINNLRKLTLFGG